MNTTIEKKNDLLDVRNDRLFHDLSECSDKSCYRKKKLSEVDA